MKTYFLLLLVMGCGGEPFTAGDQPLGPLGINHPDGSAAGSAGEDSGVMPQAGQAGDTDSGTAEAGSAGISGSSNVAGSSGNSGTGGQSGMDAGLSGSSGISGMDAGSTCNTGDLGCPCYGNNTCNSDLTCTNKFCVTKVVDAGMPDSGMPVCPTRNGVPGYAGETWICGDLSVMTECSYPDIYKAFPSFAPANWNGVAYRGIDCSNTKFHLLYMTNGSCRDQSIYDFLDPQLTGIPNGCPYK